MLTTDLKSFGDYLTQEDLVTIGLFPSVASVHTARYNGKGPKSIKIGRKILFPRLFVEEYLIELTGLPLKTTTIKPIKFTQHESISAEKSTQKEYLLNQDKLNILRVNSPMVPTPHFKRIQKDLNDFVDTLPIKLQ